MSALEVAIDEDRVAHRKAPPPKEKATVTDAWRLTAKDKRVYQLRKETVERSFADTKQLDGHRYARYRGLRRVTKQCLLAAACQNMKKIALLLAHLFNPLTVLSLIQTRWILINRFIEKNGRTANQYSEAGLMHSAN